MANGVKTSLEKADNSVQQVAGKGLSTNDYTTKEKNKLSGIEAEANKTIVDNELSNSSENPVQNKVITESQEEQDIETDRIRNQFPTKSITGNPIYINDSTDLPLKNFSIEGDTQQGENPSPSNPQEIRNVEGKNKLKTSLQIMKENNTSGTWNDNIYTINGLSITVNEDLSLIFNGTSPSQSTTTFLLCNNETIKAGTYIFNGINSINVNARMYIWDNNWTNIVSTLNTNEFTINEDKLIKVGINISSNKTFDNFLIKPMISVQGGDYVPYNSIQIKKCNKNLLDFNWLLHSISGGLTVSAIPNGVRLTNTNGYGISTQEHDLQLKPNTKYTLNCKAVWSMSAGQQNWGWQIKDLDNNIVIVTPIERTNFVSFTTGSGKNYRIWYYVGYPQENAGTVDLTEIQLVEGEYTLQTMPEYIPHAEKTYNFPLSEGQKLMQGGKIGNKVVNHRRQIKLKDLEWRYTTDGDRFLCNDISNLNIKGAISDGQPSTQILSNVFTVYSNNNIGSSNFHNDGIAITTTGLIRIKYEETTDVNVLKTMLINTNAILEYELQTPDETAFTPEQQAVIDEIKKDGTYDEVTHYTATANINPDMDIEYRTKLNNSGGSSLPEYPTFNSDKQYVLMLLPNQSQTAYELQWKEVIVTNSNQLITSDNLIFKTSDGDNFILKEEE